MFLVFVLFFFFFFFVFSFSLSLSLSLWLTLPSLSLWLSFPSLLLCLSLPILSLCFFLPLTVTLFLSLSHCHFVSLPLSLSLCFSYSLTIIFVASLSLSFLSFFLSLFLTNFYPFNSLILSFQIDYLKPLKFEWEAAYTTVLFKLKIDITDRITIFSLNLGTTDTRPPTAPGIADPTGADSNVVVFDGGLNSDIEYSPSLRKITCAWKESRSDASCMDTYEVNIFFLFLPHVFVSLFHLSSIF